LDPLSTTPPHFTVPWGATPVSNGGKNVAPENVSVPGPDVPLAHRRPGYSLSGCTPAEPDSASPGKGNCTRAKDGTQRTGSGQEVTRAKFQKLAVKIESGTQVASRGPTWRSATPLA